MLCVHSDHPIGSVRGVRAMFGYVLVNPQKLAEDEKERYRACYCGLCQTLKQQYGNIGRMTLSNDMTFLGLLLSSLYEPSEERHTIRCGLHPLKKRPCIQNSALSYAADINILLAYYKCLDDMQDENTLRGKAGVRALTNAYRQVEEKYPAVCKTVRESLSAQSELEKQKSTDLDALCRPTGQMLGACFAWQEDVFALALQQMGAALGRFIYLMDAYEDYRRDIKNGCFNPLAPIHEEKDYEQRVEDILSMEMAQCMDAFDYLPLEQDAQLLRNILYSGVWSRYAYLQHKRKETKQ